MTTFNVQNKIKMQHTDAAGVVFFSQVYHFAHDAYEELLSQNNLGLEQIMAQKKFHIPIIKSQAEYYQPMFLGQEIEVQLQVKNISTSSFLLGYKILDMKGEKLATIETIHVFIDAKTRTKTAIPAEFKAVLLIYEEDSIG